MASYRNYEEAAFAEQAARKQASVNYNRLKLDLGTTEKANEIVESLRKTGQLFGHYITKDVAGNNGWKGGKPLRTHNPGKQLGGYIYKDKFNQLPSASNRVWREADVGMNPEISRSKQDGTRLVYSNDGLLYITTDHYKSFHKIGGWR